MPVRSALEPHSRLPPKDESGSSTSKSQSKKPFTETHDSKGERQRFFKDDDKKTLQDDLREEKLGTHEGYDELMARQISKDARFVNNLEYMDESLDRIGAKAGKSEQKKRQTITQSTKASDKALDVCTFCYTPEHVPKVSIAALGMKVYLGLPETIDLVPGHCLIIPTQHVLTSLELEDDAWDEIRVSVTGYHLISINIFIEFHEMPPSHECRSKEAMHFH